MGMEGPVGKLTEAQLENNKTREQSSQQIIAEDGGVQVLENGSVGIIASNEFKSGAAKEMNADFNTREFYEKHKDLIGKEVHVKFNGPTIAMDLEKADIRVSSNWSKWFSISPENDIAEFDATLKDISDGQATFGIDGKELTVWGSEVEDIHPIEK